MASRPLNPRAPGRTAVVLLVLVSAVAPARALEPSGSHAAELLAASWPKFVPPSPTAPLTADSAGEVKPLETDVLYLPRILVRGVRLPPAWAVMSAERLMTQYLGPKTGFDRRWLNFTPLHWDFGPYTIALFGAVKNKSRAKSQFLLEEWRRANADLRDTLQRAQLTGAETADLKREIDRLIGAERPLPGK